MKRRKTEHTPGPLSRPFKADTLTAVMIPGRNLQPAFVLKRLGDASEASAEESAAKFGLIMAFALWDDPALEWESDTDPDDVLDMDASDLETLAAELFAELNKPSAIKLGIECSSVLRLGLEAANEWLPSTKAGLDAQRAQDAGEAGREAVQAGE